MNTTVAASSAHKNLNDVNQELNFTRNLQAVIGKIQAAKDFDEIMLDVSKTMCALFDAERLIIYTLSDDQTSLVTKAKTGPDTFQAIKLPIIDNTITGHVCTTKKLVHFEDVYNKSELRQTNPQLSFSHDMDKRTGYRTKQMLVAPIVHAESQALLGLVQIINHRKGQPFSTVAVEGIVEICRTLAAIIRKPQKTAQTPKSRYEQLVFDTIISSAELELATRSARKKGCDVEDVLIDDLHIDTAKIGNALSAFFGVRYEPFKKDRIKPMDLLRNLKRDYVESNAWMPIDETKEGLLVLTIDPEHIQSQRIASTIFSKHKIIYAVTTRREFNATIEQFYGGKQDEIAPGDISEMLFNLEGGEVEDETGESEETSSASDNELVKLVNKIIFDAYKMGVSDIHIEPFPGKEKTKIRFRKDGSLMSYIEVPASYRSPLVTRIKIMCDMDISEKRKPQDGKIKFRKYAPLDIELRVATIPSAGGVEDIVMRILAAGEPIPLDNMGFTTHNLEELKKIISKPYGLFFVCGPTGSGKTTTLHSILKYLNREDTKIWTAEDPVEITQKGLRQVQINVKAGLTFPAIMRSFLRADPDIIMVGEMRDKETTSIGIEASLTGHLVFATLHTNSAPESVIRLLDMGMDPFNFSDALLGILAQRLAKRLCKKCKQSYVANEREIKALLTEYCEELIPTQAFKVDAEAAYQDIYERWIKQYGDENGQVMLYKAVGCDDCNGSGFAGRVGLHELMTATDVLKKNVQERARVADMMITALNDGMRTLKQDGIEKVLQGITDIHQVRVVCIK